MKFELTTYVCDESADNTGDAVLPSSLARWGSRPDCDATNHHVEPRYTDTLKHGVYVNDHVSSVTYQRRRNEAHLFILLIKHRDDKDEDWCNAAL